MIETVFPRRVWAKTPNGKWASREAKKEDTERREDECIRKDWPYIIRK